MTPFDQGITATNGGDMDDSMLVANAFDDKGAYKRLQPDIAHDSPRFRAKVAAFQALLDRPGQTVRGVIETAGFTPIEQQLLKALPSPRVNSDLYNLQQRNRVWYDYCRQQRGVYGEEPPAVQLALCWFGAPFSSLALTASGNATSIDSRRFLNSVSPHAYRADEDDGNSLAFLEPYSKAHSGYLEQRIEGMREQGDFWMPAPGDALKEYLCGVRARSHYPLRGGATFTADNNGTNGTNRLRPPPHSKIIRMHGFQGAVNFDISSRDSLADAVTRLLGPVLGATYAIYTVAPGRAPNGKPFSVVPPRVYTVGRYYDFNDIRTVFRGDGTEDMYALFVCAPDEQPPEGQWVPADCDPVYAETVVYCTRSSASSRYYAALHSDDEAYLRMPLNAEELSPNQYFAWMLVVARILTPGAGLDALNRGEAGVLARSTFGLHRNYSDSEPVLYDPKTPAGLGFSPRAWDMLVSDTMNAWADQKVARATFDVVPTAGDKDKTSINLYIPGLAFETEPISANAFKCMASPDDKYNVLRGAPFRKALSDKVHQYLKDALLPDEHALLEIVDIWPDGRLWHGKPLSVALGDFGDALEGFEERWVVFGIQAYMHTIPSVFAIRPVFSSYTAILDDDVSFAFASNVTLDVFRDRLRAANIAGLNPDTDHFWIRQTPDNGNMYPELNPDMSDAQRARANRPSFFIAPGTTDDEWAIACRQIVSPTVWITHADASAAVRPTTRDPSRWGFCSTYENLVDMSSRLQVGRGLRTHCSPPIRRAAKPSTDYDDLYSIRLRTTMHCLDNNCHAVFGSDEPQGCRSVGNYIMHCEGHCAYSKTGDHVPETTNPVDADPVQKSASEAIQVTAEKPEEPEELETSEKPEEPEKLERPKTPETRTGLATPPTSTAKPSNKRKRHTTPARRVDPSYRPVVDDGSDDDSVASLPLSSANEDETPARKAGRAAKRRKMAEKDSVYRPQTGADDTDDDDELLSDVVTDNLDTPVTKTPATKAKNAKNTKKRKRNTDPSYRPEDGAVDDDVFEAAEPESGDGAAGPKTKKKKIVLDDPSFRPKEPGTLLYVDDQDEELRRSAVPEWEQDPTDPAGKRKRLIREKRTGLAITLVKPVAKEVKPVGVRRAATPTPTKRKPRKKSSYDTPPTEGRRRSSRSRQPSTKRLSGGSI